MGFCDVQGQVTSRIGRCQFEPKSRSCDNRSMDGMWTLLVCVGVVCSAVPSSTQDPSRYVTWFGNTITILYFLHQCHFLIQQSDLFHKSITRCSSSFCQDVISDLGSRGVAGWDTCPAGRHSPRRLPRQGYG